ncbi:DUF2809 domain-containing protein [Polaribacter sp. R77954]|uniref:DUF2809 domain-containing protein n=1 Tax=Polaribacter sp. R77954 TaxID=3093870 RepID=UPI0037C7A760
MIQFNLNYFFLFLILLLTEIIIAKYATGFIRHTFGDYLCVILLYALIKSFVKLSNLKTAIFVLLIAYAIEFLQLTNLQSFYPNKYAKVLRLILGTSFSIGDLIAYTLGIITTLVIENKLSGDAKKN